jgi:hypothetical protein
LEQNFPNPFNVSTLIRYALPGESMTTLKIFDVLGREVVTLVESVREGGVAEAGGSGTDAAGRPLGTGVYYARMRATSVADPGTVFHSVIKILMVR